MRLHGQGGKDLHRAETAVVKKTLSPQWDKRFRFRGKLRDYVHGVLELKVCELAPALTQTLTLTLTLTLNH